VSIEGKEEEGGGGGEEGEQSVATALGSRERACRMAAELPWSCSYCPVAWHRACVPPSPFVECNAAACRCSSHPAFPLPGQTFAVPTGRTAAAAAAIRTGSALWADCEEAGGAARATPRTSPDATSAAAATPAPVPAPRIVALTVSAAELAEALDPFAAEPADPLAGAVTARQLVAQDGAAGDRVRAAFAAVAASVPVTGSAAPSLSVEFRCVGGCRWLGGLGAVGSVAALLKGWVCTRGNAPAPS
jgi:hypothetical protein